VGALAALVKLVKYGHSPELLPVARKVFASGSPESGAYLVRMLVLCGQPAEAASFIAAARNDAVRNNATDAQAEALAENGDPAAALPLANTITDPVLRARALAAIADALKS
jgi:HEAT repeat protein